MPVATTELDPEKIRGEIYSMLEALTHPAYVEAMRAVRATPQDQRLAAGSRLLSPDSLRQKGVPLPKNMRISSRYFDEDFLKGVDFGDKGANGVNLVNALNTAEPGILDRLSRSYPEVLDQILSRSIPERFIPVAGCCCGGAASACGGCG
jgi:hypothetical protein